MGGPSLSSFVSERLTVASGFVSCGTAGAEIVVEEFLDGEEVSFFALIDGENCLPLASAQVTI